MPYIDALIARLGSDIDRGTRWFKQTSAQALERSGACSIGHVVSDEALLEPLLFARLADEQAGIGLDQLLIGHVPRNGQVLDIRVDTDDEGRVSLPCIGSIYTSRPRSSMALHYDPAVRSVALRQDGRPVDFQRLPPLRTRVDQIEVCRHDHPLLKPFFVDREGRPAHAEIEAASRLHMQHVDAAMDLLHQHCPLFGQRIAQLVRRLVVFEARGVNSFANIRAHGAVFINAAADDDEILFAEELAHQCGHVIFSAATADCDALFSVSPHTPLQSLSGKEGETRSLYVVLHGIFTEIAIVSILAPLLESGKCRSTRQHHELEGRLAFIISRFAADLHNLAREDIFAPAGADLFRAFMDIFVEVYEKWRPLVRLADFSNQTYTFCYHRYAALNAHRAEASLAVPLFGPPPGRSRAMVELSELGPVGFGAYRVGFEDEAHEQALSRALTRGCNLIDTAATYTHGASEALIGKVLAEHPQCQVFVMTKAGYVNEQMAASMDDLGVPPHEVLSISDDGAHCIHPRFLQAQIAASSLRLGRPCLDGFLLHNPEYHLAAAHAAGQGGAGFYDRIATAFEFMERSVRAGKIRYYGVSSNTLVETTQQATTLNLNELLRVARAVSSGGHHFRLIQFPFNLLERGAIHPHHDGESVLAIARRNGLVTFANRPLNAMRNGKAIRLVTHRDARVDEAEVRQAWHACLSWIAQRMRDLGLQGSPTEFEVVSLLDARWAELDPVTADHVFSHHFLPLMRRLSSAGYLASSDEGIFERYIGLVQSHAKDLACAHADEVHREAIEEGLLPDRTDVQPFAVAACESYLRVGLDHVLVGMRSTAYVEQFVPLLTRRPA
jgi:aryl-alcohol dehydrogenase-like predicted oxidoreductase